VFGHRDPAYGVSGGRCRPTFPRKRDAYRLQGDPPLHSWRRKGASKLGIRVRVLGDGSVVRLNRALVVFLGIASSGWRPESGVKGRARFRFMVMLGGGSDIPGAVVVPCGGNSAWPELAGRVEQGAAQVLQQPEAVAGHGQAAPAAGGAVQHGPDQGEAAGLAGEAAGDLGPAAGLAEGPLDMKFECRIRWWCSAGNRR
jgi:hypothetical protein